MGPHPKGGQLAQRFKYSNMSHWRRDLKVEIIRRLGGCCARCGFSDYRALQIDHVAGGGTHLRVNGWDVTRYKEMLTAPSGTYQLLCANCNWIKRCENGEGNKSDLNDFYLRKMDLDKLKGGLGTEETSLPV
jgi:hypothetical protein